MLHGPSFHFYAVPGDRYEIWPLAGEMRRDKLDASPREFVRIDGRIANGQTVIVHWSDGTATRLGPIYKCEPYNKHLFLEAG